MKLKSFLTEAADDFDIEGNKIAGIDDKVVYKDEKFTVKKEKDGYNLYRSNGDYEWAWNERDFILEFKNDPKRLIKKFCQKAIYSNRGKVQRAEAQYAFFTRKLNNLKDEVKDEKEWMAKYGALK